VIIVAKTQKGLEELLMKEIEEIGGKDIERWTRAVKYEGDTALLYKSCLALRTAMRIIVVIGEYQVKSYDDAYAVLKKIAWEDHFSIKNTFAIRSNTSSKLLNHSMFLGQRCKDAIVDRFYDKKGKRPNVNPVNPDFWVDVHVRDQSLTLSMDASGDSLHMRGYRVYPVEAPINEVLAAGLVLHSGWSGSQDFLDPMCGSGTIAIEAALLASCRPPQTLSRRYGFMKWYNFDENLYLQIEKDLRSKTIGMQKKIICRDKSLQAVKAAEANAREAGVHELITFERKDFFNPDKIENTIMVTNPPYDERLKLDDGIAYYKSIGDHLKKNYTGSTSWIISSNIEALKNIGLKASKRIHLLNGPLEAEFQKFEVYEGSIR
jgi:putative N6-adenine-specific DNA methylase